VNAFDDRTLGPDPIAALRRWVEEGQGDGDAAATPMVLATADSRGRPSARVVLLRGLEDRGLRFFTSYFSRKGRELTDNPFAAATFYWPQLERQVRVEGSAALLSEDESDAYFDARPRGHQLGAWASEQSAPIESREVLDERYAHFEERFEDTGVPRPHSWGGYLLVPSRIEFWQRRENRMHDRIEYVRDGRLWRATRLQP
jgi:pyridoxamine 5'-phosphate oxidase